ncbi:MAG: ABC transporter permease [Truepera sp.]|nr:ABC transporter permease [Truepera sp.]
MKSTHPPPGSKRFFSIYLAELYYTLVQQYRQPLGSLFSLLWPLLFYLFIIVVFSGTGFLAAYVERTPVSVYLFAFFGMFGALTTALQGFGQSLALERAQGWMRLRRVSPSLVTAYFSARLSAVLLLSIALTLGMLLSGVLLTDLALTLTQTLGLVVALMAGALSFAALALALGYLVAPGSAATVIHWLYVPLFFTMLMKNVDEYPLGVQLVVELLPSYHLNQIVLGTIGWHQAALWPSYLSLGLFTLIALAVAVWSYRREES